MGGDNMYNDGKSKRDIESEQNEIISRLSSAGILLKKGKKGPANGRFTGIIGRSSDILSIKLH
jgi:hypothetical protein